MYPSKSKNPQKSIVCVVDNCVSERSVDYYVSDEKKLSEVEKNYKKTFVKISGKLRGAIRPICNSGEDRLNANYIVFNSRLYRLGGFEEEGGNSRNSVDYLDLKEMEKVWVPGPEMNHRRFNPYPVILGGQLYVVSGLVNHATEYEDPAVLMEVLRTDGSGWEDIPNPPPYPSVPPRREEGEENRWIEDNIHFRKLYSQALVGVVKSESKAFMIVGIEKHKGQGKDLYELFTYAVESEDEDEIRKWRPYTKIDLSRIGNLPQRPAVVYGQLILFPGVDGLLYVIDLENDRLQAFDLYEMTPDVLIIDDDPFLVMMEPRKGKFGLFWGYFDTGVTVLMCSIFTLKRKPSLSSLLSRKPNTKLSVDLKKKSHWVSLVQNPVSNYDNNNDSNPDISEHRLNGVLLVDHHIPDIP